MSGKGSGYIVFALILVAALLCILPISAQAESSGELLEQLNELKEEQSDLQWQIQQIENSLNDNATQTEAMVEEKNRLDEQIFLLCEEKENTQRQIAGYRLLIAKTQEELEQAQADFDALHRLHKHRLRIQEEQGSLSYWSVLIQSANMSDFLDRLAMMLEIMRADRQRLTQLQQAADEVNILKDRLEKESEELENVQQQQEESLQKLADKRSQADQLLQDLIAKGDEYVLMLNQSEQKQEALMESIAQKENEYDHQAELEWLATSVPETTHSASQEENHTPSTAGWITPVPYYVLTSPFGMRLHPILGYYRMHNGVDLSCAQGTPVYASRGGIVSVTDNEEDGAGNYVQINHGDGYRSVYMHMTHYIVSLGQRVEAGQLIGYVGSTGLSDGPHLHFGISYNGTYVNPMEYID